MTTERKAIIKSADMSDDMQQDALEWATVALEKYTVEKDIAKHVKKEFDAKYTPTWHCVVGKSFGSFVTHEAKHFTYFYLGETCHMTYDGRSSLYEVRVVNQFCHAGQSAFLLFKQG